jgi:uncharacterized protein YkwD
MTSGVRQCGRTLIVGVVAAVVGLVIAFPTAAATDYQTGANQALALVNQQRAKVGCAPLRVVALLQNLAGQQSRDQAARDRLGHVGANGSTSRDRLGRLGYSQWAENIPQFQSAQQAVKFWSTSHAHRASMLNYRFRDTGLAVARSHSCRLYWTQTFDAQPNSRSRLLMSNRGAASILVI